MIFGFFWSHFGLFLAIFDPTIFKNDEEKAQGNFKFLKKISDFLKHLPNFLKMFFGAPSTSHGPNNRKFRKIRENTFSLRYLKHLLSKSSRFNKFSSDYMV